VDLTGGGRGRSGVCSFEPLVMDGLMDLSI
jgi:hypothetical protein